MRKIITVLVLFLAFAKAQGQEPECGSYTYRTKSMGAGNWNNLGDWLSPGQPPYPTSGGLKTIPSGHILLIQSPEFTLTGASLKVQSGATLIINGKLNLDAGQYLEIEAGAKLICCATPSCNPSSKLRIGGNEVWNGNDGTATGPLTYTQDGLLPVELVSFSGQFEEGGIRLKWRTASEINFDHFDVERSADGISFFPLSSINGTGDSYTPADYTFLDRRIDREGYFYYRLKSIDKDNSFEYSKIIAVYAAVSGPNIAIWPNPIRNHRLFVSNNSDDTGSTFILYDTFGRTREIRSLPAVENEIQLASDLPPGIYFAKIIGSNDTRTIRLFLLD